MTRGKRKIISQTNRLIDCVSVRAERWMSWVSGSVNNYVVNLETRTSRRNAHEHLLRVNLVISCQISTVDQNNKNKIMM